MDKEKFMEGIKMERAEDLIAGGILRIGRKAKENPENLNFPKISLGVANKDYPASTPFLWNSAYEALGISARNIRLFGSPESVEIVFQTLKNDPRYIGGDVGVGFKDKAWSVFDELDGLARAMQSVNVVVKLPEGGLKGYNTDGLGYALSLEDAFRVRGLTIHGRRVVILGGGGTANAIAFALAERGAEIKVLNRTVSKAEDLARRINAYFQKEIAGFGPRDAIAREVKKAEVVISAMDDPDSPLYEYSALGEIILPPTKENIKKSLAEAKKIMHGMLRGALISDVMLRDEDTATIREAKKAGFSTLDGRPMVLNQAIEAFWLVNQRVPEAKNITKEQVAEVMTRASSS